jgi:hypothetical protein
MKRRSPGQCIIRYEAAEGTCGARDGALLCDQPKDHAGLHFDESAGWHFTRPEWRKEEERQT